MLGFISKNELSADAIRDFLTDRNHGRGCRHEALIYSSADELAAGTVPFVQQGLTRGDQLLVVLREAGRTVLQDALGGGRSPDRVRGRHRLVSEPRACLPTVRPLPRRPPRGWSPSRTRRRRGDLAPGLGQGRCRRMEAKLGSALRWLLRPCRSSVPTTPRNCRRASSWMLAARIPSCGPERARGPAHTIRSRPRSSAAWSEVPELVPGR